MYKNLFIILALTFISVSTQAQTINLTLINLSPVTWEVDAFDSRIPVPNLLDEDIAPGDTFTETYFDVTYPITWSTTAGACSLSGIINSSPPDGSQNYLCNGRLFRINVTSNANNGTSNTIAVPTIKNITVVLQ